MRPQVNSRRISAIPATPRLARFGVLQPECLELPRIASALLKIGRTLTYTVRLDGLEDTGAVGSTKAERIRHGSAEFHLAGCVGNIIEIT